MVMNTIQSNRMPTDGGVQRGGRGWGRGYIVSSLHISYEEVLRRRSMETFRRKRLFDGVYEYVVISFQSTVEDEGRVRGRDLTIDVLYSH